MVALAREGDPGCRRVIADAGHIVGRIAAALCNAFNPERIVVGGELALAGELLLDPMRESIRRYAIPAATEDLTVVAGALGDRAELMGALALVVGQSEQVLSGRVVAAAREVSRSREIATRQHQTAGTNSKHTNHQMEDVRSE